MFFAHHTIACTSAPFQEDSLCSRLLDNIDLMNLNVRIHFSTRSIEIVSEVLNNDIGWWKKMEINNWNHISHMDV